MATLFGKNYLEAGKSSSPLLLRSNGEIKLLWGNKFIDLIKNGKICSESKEYLLTTDDSENIQDNGIYLVTKDNSIWICINGTKLSISQTENSYISFLTKLELTSELKNQALTNIGFYYDTLQDAKDVLAGLVFIKESNKLYLVKEGILTEYVVGMSSTDENVLGDLTITNTTIEGNSLNLSINGESYILLANSSIIILKSLLVDNIKSSNYVPNYSGFSLTSGKNSLLEIDSIKWRNIDSELPKDLKSYFAYTVFGNYDIIMETLDVTDSETLEVSTIDDNIFDTYILRLTPKYRIDFPDNSYLNIELLPLDTSKYEVVYPIEVLIAKIERINNEILYIYLGISTTDTFGKDSFGNNITGLNVVDRLLLSTQYKIYQSRVSLFILGLTFLALRKWQYNIDLNGNLLLTGKYVYHTILGSYKESDLGLSEDTSLKFGLFSDDIKVTGISMSKAQFTDSLPTYVDKVPETILDNQIPTMSLVNLAILKATQDVGDTTISLISKSSLPKGSIIMFNSSTNIPDEWHICDGTEGTPNLIDKFIKAGTDLKEVSEGIEFNNLTTDVVKGTDKTDNTSVITSVSIKLLNLKSYSLIFIMKIK